MGIAEVRILARDPKAHKHKHLIRDIPTLLGFMIRGFIWDIPILVFAYVVFLGPSLGGFRFRVSGSGSGWRGPRHSGLEIVSAWVFKSLWRTQNP